jgi:hypothetical protein
MSLFRHALFVVVPVDMIPVTSSHQYSAGDSALRAKGVIDLCQTPIFSECFKGPGMQVSGGKLARASGSDRLVSGTNIQQVTPI